MCNCNSSTSCNNCNSNLPCNCPPNYAVLPAPVPCNCCPPNYTYTGNSICTSLLAPFTTVPAIPCNTCVDSIPTDCVVYQCTSPNASKTCAPCVNVVNGDSLTTIIQKICPTDPANILAMLQVIAADTTYGLKAAFCQIVNHCSFIPGSPVSYIGPISFSIP